jgi:hypothetical protein
MPQPIVEADQRVAARDRSRAARHNAGLKVLVEAINARTSNCTVQFGRMLPVGRLFRASVARLYPRSQLHRLVPPLQRGFPLAI